MKIIFLDFDGVINSSPHWIHPDDRDCQPTSYNWDLYDIHKVHVEILNTIIAATGAKIVISSSWRRAHPLDTLFNMLVTQGLKGEVVGMTPVLSNSLIPTENGPVKADHHLDRGDEVKSWIDAHDVDNFVVLDDIDFLGFGHFPDNTIIIDNYTGLTPEHAKRAIAILNSE